MLEEAVEVMRLLWEGGQKSHHGEHYTVENARLYTLPEEPPKVLISGFGPKSVELAGRVGDGYCGVDPDEDLVSLFRSSGGGDKPAQAGMKACWDENEERARKSAHQLWANEALPGELDGGRGDGRRGLRLRAGPGASPGDDSPTCRSWV